MSGVSMMGNGLGGGGGGMVKGSSFNLDTKQPRMTRVHGNGLKIDLDILEIVTSGGTLKYSPTHIEFAKGLIRWITMMNEGKLSLHHNEKTVIQIYAPDESPYYLFSMSGNAAFRDVVLDRELSRKVAYNLCIVDGVFDTTATPEECKERSNAGHPSVSSNMLSIVDSLLFVSEKVANAQASAQQAISDYIESTLIQPISARVDSIQSSTASQLDELLQNNQASFTDFSSKISLQLEGLSTEVMENLATFRTTSEAMVESMNSSVMEEVLVLSFSLEDIVKSVSDMNSTIENLQLEVLPAWSTQIQSSLRDEIQTNITELRSEGYQNISALGETIRDYISSKLDAYTNSSTANLELVNSTVGEVQSSISRIHSDFENLRNESALLTTTATEELSDQVQRNLTNLRDTLLEYMTSNTDSMTELYRNQSHHTQTQLSELQDNLTNGINVELIVLKDRVENDFEGARRNISFLQEQVGNATEMASLNFSLLHAALNETNEYIDELASNTSAAIARSNSILARVIGDVNVSLSDFKNLSRLKFQEVEVELLSNLSTLENSIRNEVNTSLTTLNEELLSVSTMLQAALNESDIRTHDSIAKYTSMLNDSVTNLSSVLEQHADSVVATSQDTLYRISDLNGSFTTQLADFNASLYDDIGLLNVSLSKHLHSHEARTDSRFEVVDTFIKNQLKELKYVIGEIATVLYDQTENDQYKEAVHTSTVQGAKPKPRIDVRDVRQILRDVNGKVGKANSPSPLKHSDIQGGAEVDDSWEVVDMVHRPSHLERLDGELNEFRLLSEKYQQELNTSIYDLVHKTAENISSNLGALEVVVASNHNSSNDSLELLNSTLISSLASLQETYQVAVLQFENDLTSLGDASAANLSYVNVSLYDLVQALEGHMSEQLELVNSTMKSNDDVVHEALNSTRRNLTFIEHNIQETISLLSSTAESRYKSLETNMTTGFQRLNTTVLENVSYLLNNATRAKLILEQSIDELESNTTLRLMDLNNTLSNFIVSLQSNIQFLNESQRQGLEEAYQNLTSVQSIMTEGIAHWKRETIMNVTSVNDTVNSIQANALVTDEELRQFQANQSVMWSELDIYKRNLHDNVSYHYAMIQEQIEADRLFLDTKLSNSSDHLLHTLRTTVDGVNTTLMDLYYHQSRSLSQQIDQAVDSSAVSIRSTRDEVRSNFTSLRSDLTKVNSDLLNTIHQMRSQDMNVYMGILYGNISSLNNSVEAINRSLHSSLYDTEKYVNSSLRFAENQQKQMLDTYTAVTSGRLDQAYFRISQTENLTASLRDTSSALTVQSALLEANVSDMQSDLARLQNNSMETWNKIMLLEKQSAVDDVSLQYLTNTTLSAQSDIFQIRDQVFNLTLATGVNRRTLDQVFASVNSSYKVFESYISSTQQQIEQMDSHVNSMDMKLRGVDIQQMQISLNQAISSQNMTMQALIQEVDSSKTQINSVAESTENALTAVQQLRSDINSVMAFNMSFLARQVDESTSNANRMIEGLKSELQQERLKHEQFKTDKEVEQKTILQRLVALETRADSQDKRIAELVQENERLRRVMATQDSLDDVRKLLQDLQSSMVSQSGKIIDLVVTNLANR